MRMTGLSVLMLCVAFTMLQGEIVAQYAATTIDNIVTTPGKYSDAAVEVVGVVSLYVPAVSTSTGHYLLKSETGTVIRVNTTEKAPELRRKYRVAGIVYLDPATKAPFISEKSRVRADVTGAEEASPGQESAEKNWWEDTTILSLFALLVIVAAFVMYLRLRKKRPGLPQPAAAEPPQAVALTTTEGAVPLDLEATYPLPSDLKTVRLTPSSPMTMKYVPGELVLVSGEDKGKAFKIAGFPTPEGSIVTIGREAVTGERAYAHIQIHDRFHTVSRKQAEFIWKDKKLFVKNLSETNPTQVDGAEVKSGKLVQVKPGSIVRTGELEFQYKV